MIGAVVVAVGVWVQALAGPDSPARNAALDSLVASGDIARVTQAVFSNAWRVREGLIDVLEQQGAVDALGQIAHQHPKVDAKRLAIRSLGRVGKKEARDVLRVLLTSEHRDLAVEALGLVGDRSDADAVRALVQDERADVRRRAVLALAALLGEDALLDLAMLLGDVHHSVRFAVYDRLLTFGDAGAQVVVMNYHGLPTVGKWLALRLFGQLHYTPAKIILEHALGSEDWMLQQASVEAMGLWGDPMWLPILNLHQKEVSSAIVRQTMHRVMTQLQ